MMKASGSPVCDAAEKTLLSRDPNTNRQQHEKENTMKRIVFFLILTALVLAGCQTSPAAPAATDTPTPADPVDVARSVLEAATQFDVTQVSDRVCTAMRSDVEQQITDGLSQLEALGLTEEQVKQVMTVNLDDLTFTEASQQTDSAVVDVAGNISVNFNQDELTQVLTTAAEASGQQVSQQQIDSLISMIVSATEQPVPVDTQIDMVKEDGQWRVCSNLEIPGAGSILP
jgi:PBP1b-binding outer membrane lipoprotein LpoB